MIFPIGQPYQRIKWLASLLEMQLNKVSMTAYDHQEHRRMYHSSSASIAWVISTNELHEYLLPSSPHDLFWSSKLLCSTTNSLAAYIAASLCC